jgi:glycosyltransferase involved in cell wall biosynthesis
MLISIIITSYNHSKYLPKCIESVINQTYKNLEIIIIDNNSTDNSQEIIQTYAKKDNRIKFYKQDHNIFPSAAMNFGLSVCSGEYISLISGDDYCELNKISRQLEYMTEKKITNLFSWVNIVNDLNGLITDHSLNNVFNRNFINNDLEIYLVSKENTLCAGSVLLHKSIFEKYGLFDNRLLQLQDYDMWLRMVSYEKINILPEKLFNYRIRDDVNNLSLSNQNKSLDLRNTFERTKIVKRILSAKNEFLSELTGVYCNNTNKYKNLFNYFSSIDKNDFANGILLLMYDDLGSQFTFPSELYKDFFELYGKHDLFSITFKKQFKQILKKINLLFLRIQKKKKF